MITVVDRIMLSITRGVDDRNPTVSYCAALRLRLGSRSECGTIFLDRLIAKLAHPFEVPSF